MKSIGRFKVLWLISVSVLVSFLPTAIFAEPYFTSKAKITPVQLFQISSTATTFPRRSNESSFGPLAKISRVVPVKHVTKIRYTNFGNKSDESVRFSTSSIPAKKKPTAKLEYRQNFNSSANKSVAATTSRPVASTRSTSTTTVLPPPTRSYPQSPISGTIKPTKASHPNPLMLTSDNWEYLNSAVTDDELRHIINGFPNELIRKITNITQHNPVEGQNFLLKSIMNELSKMKRSRMLAMENDRVVAPVNKGVRFSAKHRRPILNVVPLEQKIKLGKPVKNLIKTGLVEQWNISGQISNKGKEESEKISAENSGEKSDSDRNPLPFKPSVMLPPGSTTPTLMQVLASPEKFNPAPTTVFPFAPSKKMTIVSLTSSDSNEESVGSYSKVDLTPQGIRKPRRPQKEEEYSIPSITTSSTASPEDVSKGYQTITESTTPGPKVIWYHHDQTPEDTFYPNTDPYLVPPEEASIEILTDIISVKPRPEEVSGNPQSSLLPTSSENSYKNSEEVKVNRKARPIYYPSKEKDGKATNSFWDSRYPLKKKAAAVASSSDQNGVRDYRELILDGKNGGSGAVGGLLNSVYSDRKHHGAASYNSYDIKQHEIIPRHPRTNRKPPYHVDDTESYGAFNQEDHYQSSYPLPPPPGANRHEIGAYHHHRYRTSPYESPAEEENLRVYGTNNNHNERYKEERPSTDADVYYPREPKQRVREHSPGGHHPPPKHGWGWGSHQGGKGKDFFDMAKDFFKSSDFSTANKWFDAVIGILGFLAFGGYIIMLLYQVMAVSQGSSIGTLLGRGMKGAGEIFDLFFAKGPMGEAYLDELETIVKRAMTNVKRMWKTSNLEDKVAPKMKGDAAKK